MDNSDKTRLNKEQLEAVEHVNGPMLVVAGPGSGKTHLLIERIYNLIQNDILPENILVITFSKKAALEMEGRFAKRCNGNKMNVTFGTFHAIFFGILRYHGIYTIDSILKNSDKLSFIEETAISLKIKEGLNKKWQVRLLEEISFYKNSGDRLFDEDSGFYLDEEDREEFGIVFKRYSEICRKYKKLDFDDMVTECKKLLESKADIRRFWQNRFKYILVDEFQDINKTQYEVLKLLEGDEKNVFAVGDDDQSIYGFRGSEPGIMQTFLDEHDAKQVFLKLNYRCCFEVVNAADNCIKHNKIRLSRPKQQTLKNRKKGEVVIENFENAEDEAEFISSEVDKLKKSGEYKDIAIIYRSDHCVSLIEEKIRAKGFEYDKKDRRIMFYELDTVKVIISYLRVVIDKAYLSDFLRVLNHPERGISREALNPFQNMDENMLISCNVIFDAIRDYYINLGLNEENIRLASLKILENDRELIKQLPPDAAVIYLLKKEGLYTDLKLRYKKHPDYPVDFDELLDDLKTRLSEFSSIEGFTEHVEFTSRAENDDSKPIKKGKKDLTFITAHASKGLEYDVVFVAGLQEGLFPHRKNLKEPGIEEERRLFYVAMTRAREKLYIIGRGSLYGKRTSRFLDEIKDSQSFIASNSSLSRNSSNASATASYSSSSSMYESSGSTLESFSSSQ